jgi:hypothetical protein
MCNPTTQNKMHLHKNEADVMTDKGLENIHLKYVVVNILFCRNRSKCRGESANLRKPAYCAP